MNPRSLTLDATQWSVRQEGTEVCSFLSLYIVKILLASPETVATILKIWLSYIRLLPRQNCWSRTWRCLWLQCQGFKYQLCFWYPRKAWVSCDVSWSICFKAVKLSWVLPVPFHFCLWRLCVSLKQNPWQSMLIAWLFSPSTRLSMPWRLLLLREPASARSDAVSKEERNHVLSKTEFFFLAFLTDILLVVCLHGNVFRAEGFCVAGYTAHSVGIYHTKKSCFLIKTGWAGTGAL